MVWRHKVFKVNSVAAQKLLFSMNIKTVLGLQTTIYAATAHELYMGEDHFLIGIPS